MITIRCNWNTGWSQVLDTDYTSIQYNTNIYLPTPIPTEGAIITYEVTNTSDSELSVFFSKLSFPVVQVPAINISPVEDITTFPIECSFTTTSQQIQLFYTLDGTDPINSGTAVAYTAPFIISEPKAVLYVPYYNDTRTWGKVECKLYTEVPIGEHTIFKHIYKLNGLYYVKFYSLPNNIPLVIGKKINNSFIFEPYDEQPIQLNSNTLFFIGKLSTVRNPTINTNLTYTVDIDYESIRVIPVILEIENTDWPKKYNCDYAMHINSVGFMLQPIVSVTSGVYSRAITVSIRSNFPGDIFYSINSQMVDQTYVEPIYIEESCKFYVQAVYDGINSLIQEYDYYIINQQLEQGIKYSTVKRMALPKNEATASLKCLNPAKISSLALEKFAIAYTNLKSTFSTGTYTEYAEYVISNNIFTLYADENLLYPFPFVFDLKLNPTDFFTIPDTYASVYIEGKKDYTFENVNLVCRFTIPMASNSTVTIISDYCLRLCIDTLDTKRTSMVVTAWTNIPIGNYLFTNSDNVLLSADGTTFSKVIKLTSNKLYLKGNLSQDVEYGHNINNVIISMVTNEAIDEYTF